MAKIQHRVIGERKSVAVGGVDHGCQYTETRKKLRVVPSDPQEGEYVFKDGVYIFNARDAHRLVTVDWSAS